MARESNVGILGLFRDHYFNIHTFPRRCYPLIPLFLSVFWLGTILDFSDGDTLGTRKVQKSSHQSAIWQKSTKSKDSVIQ